MFHGLTMVNFDGQTQNQMMVRPWSTMVDHGQPWSDGQTVAGDAIFYVRFFFRIKFSSIKQDSDTSNMKLILLLIAIQ